MTKEKSIEELKQELKEIFAAEMEKQEKSHKETLKNHKIIMQMIDDVMRKN